MNYTYLIIGISVAITFLSVTFLVLHNLELKNITKQIKYINRSKSNIKISSTFKNPAIKNMVFEIDNILEQDKKREEESIRKNDELRRALTYISHDIRTPLTSLSGYFELLKDEKDVVKSEKYKEIISERIYTLKEMQEQLFEYIKLQNSFYELELDNKNVSELVTKSIINFYEEINSKSIEPVIDIEEGIMLMVDENGFIRVVENVIKNALVHGNEYLEISLKKQDERVELKIINNCENIDEIVVDEVFNRFYKADKARTKTSSGLGLAIAKEFVLRMKGSISAETIDDKFIVKIEFECK